MSGSDVAKATTILKRSDLRRCVVCGRIFTPLRRARLVWCKCGNGKFTNVSWFTQNDFKEIEEDYGWEIVIDAEGLGLGSFPNGLLAPEFDPAHPSKGDRGEESKGESAGVIDSRLHSSRVEQESKELDRVRRIISSKPEHWRKALPDRLRSPKNR